MALPSSYAKENLTSPQLTGIVLNLVPGDISYNVEIQRTSALTTGGPATTAAVSLGLLPPIPEAGQTYYDYLPIDGALRYYRARHTGDFVDPSTWVPSGWTTGHLPTQLGEAEMLTGVSLLSVYPVKRNRALDDGNYALAASNTAGTVVPADVYVPATAKIYVGTTGTTGSLAKSASVLTDEFSPFTSTMAITRTVGYFNPTSSGVLIMRSAFAGIPYGAVIPAASGITATINLGSTLDLVSLTLYSYPTTAPNTRTAENTAQFGSSTFVGSWYTVTRPGAAVTIASSNAYGLEWNISSTNPTACLVGMSAIAYTVGSYDIAR